MGWNLLIAGRWLLVTAAVSGTLSLVVGWAGYWMYAAHLSDDAATAQRLRWIVFVQQVLAYGIPLVGIGILLDSTAGVGTDLLVVGIAGLLSGVVSSAPVPILARYDLFELFGYDGGKATILSFGIPGAVVCTASLLLVVLVQTATEAAVPLGVTVVVAYYALGPRITERLNETTTLPRELADRYDELAGTTDTSVRVRVLVDDESGIAAACGIVPGTRTIYVSESLLDELDPAELDAVIAHELGHVRRGHVEKKVLGYSALVGLFIAGMVSSLLFILLALVLLFVLGRWTLGSEYEADAFAAEVTSVDAMASALDRLATLGHLPHETSRTFDYLSEHPSVKRRLDRLGVEPE